MSGPRTWQVGTLRYTLGGLVLLFFWLLLGDFAFQLRERSAQPVTTALLKIYEATDLMISLLMVSVPAAMVLLVSPAISYWSDHHRGPRGRRIPFLLLPTPLVLLSMGGLAFSTALGRWLHGVIGGDPAMVHLSILTVIALSTVLFELVTVISNTLFGSLVNDVVPRQMLGLFYGFFRAVSLAAGILFGYTILGHAEQHYTIIFYGIGAFYAVAFTVMCLMVKEGEYPPPPANALRGNLPLKLLQTYFRDCMAHPYYRLAIVYVALAALSFVPVNTFSQLAAKDFGMSLQTFGEYLGITYTFSIVLAIPLGWLADRLHPLRLGLTALALYGVTMTASYFLITDAPSFGMALLVHGVLSGVYFTGAAALGQMLFPKLRFAQFASAAGLLAAFLQMIIAPLFGQALDWMGSNYRLTFLWGAGIAFFTLWLGLRLHRRWLALGGLKNYLAP